MPENVLESDMKSKTMLTVIGAIVLAFSAGAALADGTAALTKGGCMAYHAKDKKMVGPSFKEIAAKYKGQDAGAALFDKVRKGGSGVFGPIPMAPNPVSRISDPDLKDAIATILGS